MNGFVIEPDGTVWPVDPVAPVDAEPTEATGDSEQVWRRWLLQVRSACGLLAVGFAELAGAAHDLAAGDPGDGSGSSAGGPEVVEWTTG